MKRLVIAVLVVLSVVPVMARAALAGAGFPRPTIIDASRVIQATPDDYLALVAKLRPGDTLMLAPGNYGVDWTGRDTFDAPGLPLQGLNGTASAPIIITGPESGPPAILFGRSTHNTVRFADSSYVIVRNLHIDNRRTGGAAVATEGISHHIMVEHLTIYGLNDRQQTVAISCVQGPTWNWTVRDNLLINPGTGMYFGNSDGRWPFVAGLIERNVVRDSIGYNIEVKHQVAWTGIPPGMPVEPTATVIRYNILTKRSAYVSPDGARPNLLVGDQPPSGPGSQNRFEIYGNFIYENPTESLFQGEGNIAFYDNVLMNTAGSAVRIQRHNGLVRQIDIFHNTIVARDSGINVMGGRAGSQQVVVANAVFAEDPIRIEGADATQSDNAMASVKEAALYLVHPDGPLEVLDLRPRDDRLAGATLEPARLARYIDANLDFARIPRTREQRGAYLRPLDQARGSDLKR